MPTNAADAPRTAISDAPVGRWARAGCRAVIGRRGPARIPRRLVRRCSHHQPSMAPGADIALTATAPVPRPFQRTSGPCQCPAAPSGHGCGAGMHERARGRTSSRSSPASPWSRSAWSPSATAPSPGSRRRSFRAVNDLPGWLYPVVWPFQQLGALLLGPVVAVVALAPAPLPPRRRRLRRHRAEAGQRAGRQGGGQPRAPGHLDRPRRRAARRRPHGRRELRVGARRAGGRTRRRRHALPPGAVEGGAVGPRRCGHGRAGCTSAPTTPSTWCAAPRSASPSPERSTWRPRHAGTSPPEGRGGPPWREVSRARPVAPPVSPVAASRSPPSPWRWSRCRRAPGTTRRPTSPPRSTTT